MALDTALLQPAMLGSWVKILRLAQKWSQDALAEASGLTVRTVQRVEAGERTSRTTRRGLARGLGYDIADVLDDPECTAGIVKFYETINADQAATVEANHPDHLKLTVKPLETGGALAGVIAACSSWMFHCDEEAPADAQLVATGLFNLVPDYGDIWEDLSFSGRVQFQANLAAPLDALKALGMRAYQTTRATQIVGKNWVDPTPLPMTIGCVAIIPADRDLSHTLVPKRWG